jgi:hypothetical protein
MHLYDGTYIISNSFFPLTFLLITSFKSNCYKTMRQRLKSSRQLESNEIGVWYRNRQYASLRHTWKVTFKVWMLRICAWLKYIN